MAYFYKNGNDNFKMISVLFALQVIFGVLPVVLLVCYIFLNLYTNPLLGYIFIGIMLLTAIANIVVTKRYNVLISGLRGEKSLMKTLKKLGKDYTVFTNQPIRYKKNRSEIDFLVICEKYIMIIEVKNHNGYIYGKHKDESWTQRKVYKDGKTTETSIQNPIKQMRRQREILKNILMYHDIEAWVDTVLYFSAPSVHLYLDLVDSDNVCSDSDELMEFLSGYEAPKPIGKEKADKIVQVLSQYNDKKKRRKR